MNPKNQLKKRRKYDEDVKGEVLQMIENGQSVSTVSQSLGIGENLLYRWKNKQKNKVKSALQGESNDFSLKLLEENESLKEKVKQLEIEREIVEPMLMLVAGPKSLVHFQPSDLRVRYELIAVLEADFKVEILCQLLQVVPAAASEP